MISYRQADLLDQFAHDNDVVATAYLDYKTFGQIGDRQKFVIDFHLAYDSNDIKEKQASSKLFEDIYEGLPSVIRDRYLQHPQGYVPHHSDIHSLTMETYSSSGPYPEYVEQCVTQRFAQRGIDNDVMNPPHGINVGTPGLYFIMGEYRIKVKDIYPFMKKASILKRRADLLERYMNPTKFTVKFLLTSRLTYVSSRQPWSAYTRDIADQKNHLEEALFEIFKRIGFTLDGLTWDYNGDPDDAPRVINEIKEALRGDPRFSNISGDGPNLTSFSVDVL